MSKEDFLKHFDSIPAQLPIQGKARAIIHNGLDFPTTRDEYWKYTRVAPVINSSYVHNCPTMDVVKATLGTMTESAHAVFVNGAFQAGLGQDLPEGVLIHALSATSDDRLGSLTAIDKDAFHALNTAYFEAGIAITVTAAYSSEAPLRILHLCIGGQQASNPRILIDIEPFAAIEIIHQFEGSDTDQSFTNAIAEVWVGEGAHCSYYLIENEGLTASMVQNTLVSQGANSTFNAFTVTLSGKLVRNNLNATITAEGCETNMYGIYFLDGMQHVDNHTFADHQMPNCNSNELYKGVMSGQSTAVFNGKIMVRKGAQKTNAYQSNQNVLLSETATINSKPELEIYADDVKCSHGCTVGQLDEEALFYLRSRGLSLKEARQLLIQAFAADITAKIGPPALRDRVESFITHKFTQV